MKVNKIVGFIGIALGVIGLLGAILEYMRGITSNLSVGVIVIILILIIGGIRLFNKKEVISSPKAPDDNSEQAKEAK